MLDNSVSNRVAEQQIDKLQVPSGQEPHIARMFMDVSSTAIKAVTASHRGLMPQLLARLLEISQMCSRVIFLHPERPEARPACADRPFHKKLVHTVTLAGTRGQQATSGS